MSFEQIAEELRKTGIVPVVTIEDENDAEALSDALCEGGIPAAEITFRTKAAAVAIRRMHLRHPEMLVGAGTVLTPEQAELARGNGASFIVSPGLNPVTAEYCLSREIPYCPGIATASEIEQAMSFGLTYVKFFPAEQMGGLATIKALSAPYPDIRFMPTGGITRENARQYLSYEKVFAVGGSFLTPAGLIREGRFEEIGKLAAETADLLGR